MAADARTWIKRKIPAISRRDELLAQRAARIERLKARIRRLETRIGRLETRTGRLETKLTDRSEQVKRLKPHLASLNQEASGLRVALEQERTEHQHLRSLVAPGVVVTNQGSLPSFERSLLDLRRRTRTLGQIDPERRHPLAQVPRKLRNYELAATHGVPIPDVFDVWSDVEDIGLSDMPEKFVLKSDRGAGGRGVLPLCRIGYDLYQVVGGTKTFSRRDVITHLSHRSLAGPFFAEAMLIQPGGGALPEDMKFYMFYGEVGHIMLRRMGAHADLKQASFRYLDQEGADLADDIAPTRRTDSTIAIPNGLEEYVEVARHLSRALAIPFVRVDVYETVDGPVLGELTRGPGGKQVHREDHDRHLGRLWDSAQYRLDLDVVAGRPLRNLRGEHPHPSFYPPGYDLPGLQTKDEIEAATLPCTAWCF